jgi:Cdc6-like AAA superfamily ATPase
MPPLTWEERQTEVHNVFTPAASIQSREFFSGRITQLELIQETINEVGRHAIVFGERGVGKTSMVNILGALFPDLGVVRVACDSDDTYPTLWRKVFRRLHVNVERRGAGFVPLASTDAIALADAMSVEDIDVDNVVTAIEPIGSELVVVLDEFERLQRDQPKRLVADTIKGLSDIGCGASIILVGVARDVAELVGEHPSVERNLRQIRMPRMSKDELREIVKRGLNALEMTIEHGVRDQIVGLSQGFPHYTHLLGRYCALEAIALENDRITASDFDVAIESAIADTQESIRNGYQLATMTARERTIFPAVLLAAALASEDEHGTFRAADMVEPLSDLLGRRYETAGFTYNLGKLTSAERGNVLERVGGANPRYRFTNPLMKPYILLKAFGAGHITEEMLAPVEPQ